ncbi:MAG TPA: hypothetical protein VFA26_10160 [Gemmataceae bacterium]|nr:hypothetical protein [Gemmataceae bacterium]
MRTLGKVLLLAGLFGLVTAAQAQRQRQPGFGGFGGFGGPGMLLQNKSVQEELKLTEDQKGKITKKSEELSAKRREAFGKLRDLPEDERREAFTKLGKEMAEESTKMAKDVLKPDQYKRLEQIQLQVQGVRAFSDEKVQKALKLDDEQREKIKTITDDFTKDSQEVFRDVGRDFQKMPEAMKKVQNLNKEATEKAVSLLNANQKKTWKELTGEPFTIKMEGFGRGFGKDRPKKKDF